MLGRAVPSIGPARKLVGTAWMTTTAEMEVSGHHMFVRNSREAAYGRGAILKKKENGRVIPLRRVVVEPPNLMPFQEYLSSIRH